MSNAVLNEACELKIEELDQVSGGFLPIVLGVLAGAVVGGVALAAAVGVADVITHAAGKGCILD